MQGAFEEEKNENYIKKSYKNRRPMAEFFKFDQLSVPQTVDEAFERCKFNIPKFSFYYICAFCISGLLVSLGNIVLIIPLFLSALLFYASSLDYKVGNYELTPQYAFYADVALNILLVLVFRSISHAFLVLVAFSAITSVLVLVHAGLMVKEEEDSKV